MPGPKATEKLRRLVTFYHREMAAILAQPKVDKFDRERLERIATRLRELAATISAKRNTAK